MDKHNLLHPPLPVKNLTIKEEALLIAEVNNGKFSVAFMDAHFGPLHKSMDVPVKDFSKFLDSSVCRNLKAVIFILVDGNNMSHNVNLEIRQMVNEEVTKRKWHIYLVHSKAFATMLALFASKIHTEPGDVILDVLSLGQMVCVSKLRRKPEGYSYIDVRLIVRLNTNINDVAAECLRTCNPKYVIVDDSHNSDLVMSLKSRFIPSKNVISIDSEDDSKYTQQGLKTIFDRGCNQLIPSSMENLAVTNESKFTHPEQAVITVDGCEDLPFEKVQVVPKSKMPYSVAYLDKTSGTYKPAGKAQISKEQEGHHRIKLALVVDQNSLPFLYQEPFTVPQIEALPQKLASRPNLNVPVIVFFDNSSVICVRDENGYKFLNEWNGLYGNDLYLSYEHEEPTMITDLNNVNDNDPFVVYDLIKILSLPSNDLKADPKWGFKVTSDTDNPVLLEIETFLGSRKAATPVFMMALLLKHHIKVIKKETGKKPKELGFCLFNVFTIEEKKRIQNGLKEACKLLKIGFVFVSNV